MATGFGVILAVVGLLTLFVGVETHRDSPSRIASLGKVSPSEITGETQPVSLKTAETQFPLEPLSNDQTFERTNEQGTSRNESIAVQRSQPDAIVASELPKPDSAGAKKTLSVPAVQKKTVEKSAGAEKVSDAGWTVQAIATTDKRIASDWLEKLKAKGYEPFVIKAEIKGRTWYRVRAGRFHTPAEGESLRSALQSQEGLRDAFIAPTTKSDAVIALSLQ